MMYIILIHASERSEQGYKMEDHLRQLMDDYNSRLEEAGIKVMAKGITPSHQAKRIAFLKEGKVYSMGPFTPIEEQISGFFLIDVQNEEQANAWFDQVPDPIGGGQGLIELRRLY